MKGKSAGLTLLCVNSDYESVMFSVIGVSNDAKENLVREAVKHMFDLFISCLFGPDIGEC